MSRLIWVVLVGSGLVVGGCNVFDTSGGNPTTVEALLADARSAMTAGNSARAVQLLERAFDRDSTDIRVRVELGNALLVNRGLDAFSLREAAEYLDNPSGFPEAPQTQSADSRHAQSVCSDGGEPSTSPSRYTTISMEADPLQDWVAEKPIVRRAQRLLVPVVLSRGTAFETARLGLRRKGLLVGTVAVVASHVIAVHDMFDATSGTLYLDRGGTERALLACMETKTDLERAREVLCDFNESLRQGEEWLRERSRLSGSDEESVLVGQLETILALTSARVTCPAPPE